MEKKCFKCKRNKPLRLFYKHPEMADKHLNKCKSCTKKDVSDNYQDKRDKYAEYERKRFQDTARKEWAIEYQRKRRAKYPGKYKAMSAVSNALRDGRLQKKPCELCGENSQAHHDDYRRPLNVR